MMIMICPRRRKMHLRCGNFKHVFWRISLKWQLNKWVEEAPEEGDIPSAYRGRIFERYYLIFIVVSKEPEVVKVILFILTIQIPISMFWEVS